METIVEELKKAVKFKDTTEIGDVILIVNEPQEDGPVGLSYAQVTDFIRDDSKRDEWWFVHMVILVVPPQPQVLILQNPHFTGQEIFTIGGKKVFIKAIDAQGLTQSKAEKPSPPQKPSGGLKIVK